MKKHTSILAISILLASASYGSFKLGEARARQKGLDALAVISLWTVKPAIHLVDLAATKELAVPPSLMDTANGAIYMVAQQSRLFAREPERLDADSRAVLCKMAKNRDRYRSNSPDVFDPYLMEHLAKLESQLATMNAQSACRV